MNSVPPMVLEVAIEQSMRSVCLSQRGCAIWTYERSGSHPIILGRGYNRHMGTGGCRHTQECKATCRSEAVHAEQVALMDALWNGLQQNRGSVYVVHVKTKDNGTLVPSGPPSCDQCSKLILASPLRISGVYLYHEDGWAFYKSQYFHDLSVKGRAHAVIS